MVELDDVGDKVELLMHDHLGEKCDKGTCQPHGNTESYGEPAPDNLTMPSQVPRSMSRVGDGGLFVGVPHLVITEHVHFT